MITPPERDYSFSPETAANIGAIQAEGRTYFLHQRKLDVSDLMMTIIDSDEFNIGVMY